LNILINICIGRLFDGWDVIQDDWIKMRVVMTYNRNVVDNLVPIKIKETAEIFLKKFP
jgi:hypothetical protein